MPAETSLAAADLLSTSFLGPWVRPPSAPGKARGNDDLAADRRQQVYLSIANWYHGAKFMPHRPDLRDSVLVCPSLKEAHKFALKHKAEWRGDWDLIRLNVLVSGLAMLHLQRPEIGLHAIELSQLQEGLQQMGLPKSFVRDCFARFEGWRTAPRLVVFGAEGAPDSVVSPRIAKLVAPLPTWTLITTCGQRTAWRLHDWALYHFVPVEYHGSRTRRHSRDLSQELVQAADQVLVFEERRAKRFDRVIAFAKLHKKKLALELYDPATGSSKGQLSIV
jgi:hypothetical protein